MSNDSQNPVMSDLECLDEGPDLTWIARNVDKWPVADSLKLMKTSNGNGEFRASWTYSRDSRGFTREQWQAERQRLGLDRATDKESLLVRWDGEGLPPAGTECEFKTVAWRAGRVVGYVTGRHGKQGIVQFPGDWQCFSEEDVPERIRPVRTPEEVEREELISAASLALLREEKIGLGIDGSKWAAKALYEAGLLRKQGARLDVAENINPDEIIAWAEDVQRSEGTDFQASQRALLMAEAILEAQS